MSNSLKKIACFVKKNAKFRDAKMLKPFHYHQKLCRNLLLKPRGGSLTPRANKNKKSQRLKILKKNVRKCINLRVLASVVR